MTIVDALLPSLHTRFPWKDSWTWSKSGDRIMFVADTGDWRGAMAALPDPDGNTVHVRFLAADRRHFAIYRIASFKSAELVDPAMVGDSIRDECLRILKALDSSDAGENDLLIDFDERTVLRKEEQPTREGFFEGHVVPALDPDRPALYDETISFRIDDLKVSGRQKADQLVEAGVWNNGEFAPARFDLGALPWILQNNRDRLSNIHDQRPWIFSYLDPTKKNVFRFLDLIEDQGDCSSISAETCARALTEWAGEHHLEHGKWPVSAAAVRSCDRHHRRTGRIERHHLKGALAMASALPPSWLPGSEEDWVRLTNLWPLYRHRLSGTPEELGLLLRHTKGDWRSLLRSMGLESEGIDEKKHVESHLRGIVDMIDHIVECIVDPVLERRNYMADDGWVDGFHVARRMLTEDGGIGLLGEKSARWHDVQARLPVPSAIPGMDIRWKALTEPFVAEGLGSLTFLVSEHELIAEGRAMNHCVGSYGDGCRAQSMHIASVRAEGTRGTRLSTIEVTVASGVPTIVQNHGPRNHPPSEQAVAVVDAWLEMVKTTRILKKTSTRPRTQWKRGEKRRVFQEPLLGTPADWKGILQRRLVHMSWDQLYDEIVHLAGTTPVVADVHGDQHEFED